MRISDWSSDVCSSDLATQGGEGAGKRLRLDVRLEDSITGFGVRADDTVTRERRTLRARYPLVDSASGAVLLDATAGQDAGIDVVGSEYATYAADSTTLEIGRAPWRERGCTNVYIR